MSRLLEALQERVLLCDGAMGSRIQALALDVARDYDGRENCTEVLNVTRPDVVRDIHLSYLQAGADMVQTNSFGASPVTLAEFGLEREALGLNKRAGEIAREAIEHMGDGRARFVLGSIGPGTKLPSLGHIGYDRLEEALTVQAQGLLAGGVDAILIETCQDPLQIKAAINGAKAARAAAGADQPILVQVTVETTGTLLAGTDIAAAATIIQALDVPLLGLNCATGPREMAEHVKWLAQHWPGLISVQPNAGLPELVDGKAQYPLQPEELARWLERYVREEGVNLIGGCCGTTERHIKALDAMLARLDPKRPKPRARAAVWIPAIASLYAQVPLRQEQAYLSIGERCNANGSKQFRERQAAGDWEGCVAIGREQVREASHAIDVCVAFVGRDEVADMTEIVGRMRGAISAPLAFDSTELPVLQAAFKLYGGKPILNSINFEDGEEPAARRLELARKFGAAVIALTIDERGMAKEVDRKLEIAKRLYAFAVDRHGLKPEDLIFDPLTFTICTGNEDDRQLGMATLEGIARIAQELPRCQILLGLSNISFGLAPTARHVLNSVFLDHALKRGLTAAIVHKGRIMPLHKIAEAELRAAEDLIFDRRRPGYDPLQAFIALFSGRAAEARKAVRADTVEERLKNRIVDGDRQGLEADLELALKTYPPLDIINRFLLDGMKVVGELFGAGKMQLPFVLQSAETMKAAVAWLEPHMERIEGQARGTVVLATVKGDVHDIGKNLVDIILTNNGYRVVNLGIKQPIASILEAAAKARADAIGMSGLLVKSTVVMRENLEEMTRQGLGIPVLLGGAALTRRYVEEDCAKAYGAGRVAYAGDAFDGLDLMDKIVTGRFDAHVRQAQEARAAKPSSRKRLGRPAEARPRPVDWAEIALRRADLAALVDVPKPPFWGPSVIERVDPKTLIPYLNRTMLFQFQWGYRKAGKSRAEFRQWAKREVEPILRRMLDLCARENILQPQAIYGFWKAASDKDDLVLFDTDGKTEVARFHLPRQKRDGGLCIADFFRDIGANERDVCGLQLVTMGAKVSEVARAWFAADRYQDYLYLHGLSVELTEALAEYVHKRARADLGLADQDAAEIDKLLKQGYRGSRYSFGYPACPNLEDQVPILHLLGAERVGVSLSEGFQLEPEQSTTAIIVHHPQAKYFSV
jgi:5-methyltetrahydrofolate--homocysteine methyltransferase